MFYIKKGILKRNPLKTFKRKKPQSLIIIHGNTDRLHDSSASIFLSYFPKKMLKKLASGLKTGYSKALELSKPDAPLLTSFCTYLLTEVLLRRCTPLRPAPGALQGLSLCHYRISNL